MRLARHASEGNRACPRIAFASADCPGRQRGTERRRYLTFDTLACKLKAIPAERWQQSDNLVARANLPNMQSSQNRKVEIYAEAVGGPLEFEQDGDKRAKYIEFIDIYAGLTDNEYRRYRQQYREDSSCRLRIWGTRFIPMTSGAEACLMGGR